MAFGNVYDPTQSQAVGLSLEEMMQDPEFLDLLAGAGYIPGQQGMPEGMHVGGTYKAAHPLQFAAAAGSNILGLVKGKQTTRAMLQKMAAALRGRGSNPSGLNAGMKPDPYDTELKPDPYGE
jgi:hypothetical protein